MTPFILNDETQVNSYGFVVLNAGGKLDRFKKNAVMLSGHDNKNIVGKWNNLSISDSNMMAEPEFDEADPEALKVKGKVDRGYLKGASIGIVINAMEFQMHNGQMVQCATDWELLEASIVSVPSNANCLRLYNTNGEQLQTSEQIQLSLQSILKNKENIMSEIVKLTADAVTALGITNTADTETISKAIVDLGSRAKKAEDALIAKATLQATALIAKAIADGKITADKKEAFEKLAVDDYAQAETILTAMDSKTTLGDKIKNNQAEAGREGWDFRKYQKEDPKGLAKMQAENFEAYETLRLSYGK